VFQGGIKAVIWTDFLQGVVMVVASLVVIVLGLIHVGGFIPVWEKSNEGQRIKIFEYVHILLSRRRLGNGILVLSNKFAYSKALTHF
jgi:Na+/proline symporter